MTVDGIKIALRKFNPSTDSGFIYSSFPKGVYYAPNEEIHYDKQEWFENFYRYLNELLKTATIPIACVQEDPHVILAYSIIDKDVLHFVYVKELFRKQGLATLLTKNKGIVGVNMVNLTKIGADILAHHPLAFIELKKEKKNE